MTEGELTGLRWLTSEWRQPQSTYMVMLCRKLVTQGYAESAKFDGVEMFALTISGHLRLREIGPPPPPAEEIAPSPVWKSHRVKYLPGQLDATRHKLAMLVREAKRLGLTDILTEEEKR